jgi:glutamate dehydrogenase (NADP+)
MSYVKTVLESVRKRNANEPEFLQAVQEVVESLEPVVAARPILETERILDRVVEPERMIVFRVPWEDDKGVFHVNRGFRVEFSSAIGPYKGACAFIRRGPEHPEVSGFRADLHDLDHTLPMGGGKGRSDFDPKGKYDPRGHAVLPSFMSRAVPPHRSDTDVQAGDIGVVGREIGYSSAISSGCAKDSRGVLTAKACAGVGR